MPRFHHCLSFVLVFFLIVLFTFPALGNDLPSTTSSKPSASYTDDSETTLSAVDLLDTLARGNKIVRYINGSTLLVTGGGLLFIGVITCLEDDPISEAISRFGFIAGGAICGLSMIRFNVLTSTEKTYARVMSISDPGERESAAYSSLVSLAARAKTKRTIIGIGSTLMGTYFLIRHFQYTDVDYYRNEHLSTALNCSVIAAINLFIESREERLLNYYDEKREQSAFIDHTSLRFGYDPMQNTVTALISFSY